MEKTENEVNISILKDVIAQVEDDIKVLQANIETAKEILDNAEIDDTKVDNNFIDKYLDIEKNLQHIKLV